MHSLSPLSSLFTFCPPHPPFHFTSLIRSPLHLPSLSSTGPKGFPGVPGMEGYHGVPGDPSDEKGFQGNPGAQGLPGPKGMPGLTGSNGISGFPGMSGPRVSPCCLVPIVSLLQPAPVVFMLNMFNNQVRTDGHLCPI